MNDSVLSNITCSNPDCRIGETGKCVEGFTKIHECPHQQEKAEIEDDFEKDPSIEDKEAVEKSNSEDINLANGKILSQKAAAKVLQSNRSFVVAVVGPFGSGKTTLSLSLYDSFQDGPFESWSFVGSQTLRSFEENCHLSRIDCGNTRAETKRTSFADDLKFWHLELREDDEKEFNLLISDRSGEWYTLSADSSEDCESLIEILRADYVIILIDGKKLCGDERHGVKNDASMLIASLIDCGMLKKDHRIGITLTKYDYVIESSHSNRAENDFKDLFERIKTRFVDDVLDIQSHKIAARPENDKVEPMHGVSEILKQITISKEVKSYKQSIKIDPERFFLKFKTQSERG